MSNGTQRTLAATLGMRASFGTPTRRSVPSAMARCTARRSVQDELPEFPNDVLIQLARQAGHDAERLILRHGCLVSPLVDHRREGVADRHHAHEIVELACLKDPNFALAHAGIAYTCFLEVFHGYGDNPAEWLAQGLAAGEQAVALDDKDGFTLNGPG